MTNTDVMMLDGPKYTFLPHSYCLHHGTGCRLFSLVVVVVVIQIEDISTIKEAFLHLLLYSVLASHSHIPYTYNTSTNNHHYLS